MNLIAELESEAAYADLMAEGFRREKKRADDAERMIALVVEAAGGAVTIDYHQVSKGFDDLVLERMNCAYDMSLRLRAFRSMTPTPHTGAK